MIRHDIVRAAAVDLRRIDLQSGIARFRAGGSQLPFQILQLRMFPPIALVVPYFVLFNELNILDNIGSLILVYIAIALIAD